MEITYFIIYIFMLFFYVFCYYKLNHNLFYILENKDAKEFDIFISLHSLLFMIATVIIQLFNYVFFFIFMNKYGGDWKYIIPIGILCIILLLLVTITGFKYKKIS